jgi:ketosteroid isomerase-like protein
VSQENVEIVARYLGAAVRRIATYWQHPRPILDALESGDLDADSREVLDHMHPEMRWKNALGIVFEGKPDCARGVDELLEASRSYVVTVDDVIDLGGDRVLAVLGVGMKGRSSGATGSVSIFSVLTVRGGLITEADEYLSRADALEAARLAE